ncbi:MAG: hypothetical protein QNK40_16405, partial [Desulfobacterales bacterium]|nr:hypothetical protein [Desulfobacterales bacterium]
RCNNIIVIRNLLSVKRASEWDKKTLTPRPLVCYKVAVDRKLKKVRSTVSIPHLFYFPDTPRYCGLKYLSKRGDISTYPNFGTLQKSCDIILPIAVLIRFPILSTQA